MRAAALDNPESHRLHKQAEQPRREPPTADEGSSGQTPWDVIERVAGDPRRLPRAASPAITSWTIAPGIGADERGASRAGQQLGDDHRNRRTTADSMPLQPSGFPVNVVQTLRRARLAFDTVCADKERGR